MNVRRLAGLVAGCFFASTCALHSERVASAPVATKSAVKVGVIYSKTGPLGNYGTQWLAGFKVGLDYVTHGTGIVDGHKLEVTEADDAGVPATAITEEKAMIGQGVKIIAGTVSSGIAVQLAPLAKENNILFISGPAATDGVTGVNRNTFRSGRQTYEDVATAAHIIGDVKGKSILVLSQDSVFGKANFAAVAQVMGGANVSSLLVPLSANDFAPFALKAKLAHPDLLYFAWGGPLANAVFQALDDQGVFAQTKIVTGLDPTAVRGAVLPALAKITFISHYFYQCCKNRANDYLVNAIKKNGAPPVLFEADGFVAAQMIAHAVETADGDDVNKMIGALEGWTFNAPKGGQTIRAADHAMLQRMFISKLEGSGANPDVKLVRTLEPFSVAPPVHAFP